MYRRSVCRLFRLLLLIDSSLSYLLLLVAAAPSVLLSTPLLLFREVEVVLDRSSSQLAANASRRCSDDECDRLE